MNKVIAITVFLIVSLALYVSVRLIKTSDKKTKFIKKCLTFVMTITLASAAMIIMQQGYDKVIAPNIIAYNIEHGIPNNDNGPMTVFSNQIVPTVRAAESSDNDAPTIQISEDIVFVDSSNKSHSAGDLIGKRICTYYTGINGEVCIFIGQYDDNYNWNGDCSICAYKDGHLFFSTEDVYEHGNIMSFRRLSKSSSSERWLITNKRAMENGLTAGDTRSYPYYDIDSKINDIDIYSQSISYMPQTSDIYTLDELSDRMAPNIIKHYNGMYDSDGNWEDKTGNAYSIEYKNGIITTIIKGVFVDNSFLSGHQYDINQDGTVTHTFGRFRERPNGEVVNDDNVFSETLSMEQFKIILQEEKYKDEVLSNI